MKQEMPYFNLPSDVGLINVKVNKVIMCRRMVILIPDFLLDVTAVAECYSYDGSKCEVYFEEIHQNQLVNLYSLGFVPIIS
ncbi:MAG: hypothetical protein IPN87_13755 [Saprospiraceae bacterium]|nr:hypothetical protein [Candidatus Brachybacter algidus]